MREKINKFLNSSEFFLFARKGIKRFNENHFKNRKVKRRATSSENRKFVVVVVKSALGVVKEMSANGGCMKLLWANVGLAREGKALAIVRGWRIGDGSWNVLFDSLF